LNDDLADLDHPQAEDQELDFEEKKRRHNKKLQLKGKRSVEVEHTENSRDFQYFYQSATGENLFLHPLCFKILDGQYPHS